MRMVYIHNSYRFQELHPECVGSCCVFLKRFRTHFVHDIYATYRSCLWGYTLIRASSGVSSLTSLLMANNIAVASIIFHLLLRLQQSRNFWLTSVEIEDSCVLFDIFNRHIRRRISLICSLRSLLRLYYCCRRRSLLFLLPLLLPPLLLFLLLLPFRLDIAR